MDKSPDYHPVTVLLLAFLLLAAATSPVHAAKPKLDPRTAALVAAVQIVSPDPLGGQLGLALVSNARDVAAKQTGEKPTEHASTARHYQHAYAEWKAGVKS